MIIAGDIGGTKTILAVFERVGPRLLCMEKRIYSSKSFDALEPILQAFLTEVGVQPTNVCLGVAGPVVSGQCRTTNLPWTVNQQAIEKHLNITDVEVINDLMATAYGIPRLEEHELQHVQRGKQQNGNRVLIAAGTGLGESILFWDGSSHVPCPSEGGHVDFGPRNDWEIELLKFLSIRFGHVSYERILSGSGFAHIFDFLYSRGSKPSPAVLEALIHASDPSPVITRAGLKNECSVCREVVDRFVEIYGAESGNLALKALAVGGVYIGGGIVGHIAEGLKEEKFLTGFMDKGRFRQILCDIPVKFILNPETALIGAAHHADRRSP